MNSKSLNPFVINKAVLAPFLSSNALVATVVPIRNELICLAGILLFKGIYIFKYCYKILLIPSLGPSPYRLSSDNNL
jgi:hypothetical protein